MNDIGYKCLPYEGSELQKTVRYGRGDLSNLKYYTEMAVDHHKKENNPKQVEFFTQALNEINQIEGKN